MSIQRHNDDALTGAQAKQDDEWQLWAQFPTSVCPDLTYMRETDSTNAQLVQQVEDTIAQGQVSSLEPYTTVVASQQTQGRGRYARAWMDAPGALLFSTLVKVPTPYLSWVTLVAGLALKKATQVPNTQLKWPNDLLLDGRKIAGILSEHVAAAGQTEAEGEQHWVVVGVGLNIGQVPSVENPLNAVPAGALETDPNERPQILKRFLEELRTYLQDLTQVNAGEAKLREWQAEYMGASIGAGSEASVTLATGERLEGTMLGVGLLGTLELEVDGERRSVTTADVALSAKAGTDPSRVGHVEIRDEGSEAANAEGSR
ncbi:biotin--[acetyl-CoA-carboxylase] ligase [Gleimia hominis]|uniref:biotin--[acetyl-CoA-carboxylase] ligase n=1 Tax=Gleimia hominis TaxID=595468 RepID=UPI000C7F7BBC|nr:biotin--[acetyl-CoA-carboxylase] ligase [Gleimia hominis]WIK64410.1 biotin--[acetyl-CoA-carboxylase] ligase [Gleimia hominis]